MPVNVLIGGNGRAAHATIIEGGTASRYRPTGLAVYTQPHSLEYYEAVNGVDIDGNVNLAIDGTTYPANTDNIHNGIDNVYWTATATSGTWVFNSITQANTGTRSIDGTATDNGNTARLDRASSIDPTDYEYIEGYIYITSEGSGGGSKALNVQLYNSADVAVGSSVNIYNYVDITTLNSWQRFQLPISAFNGTIGNDVDRIDLIVVNTAGQPVDFYLDDLQFSEIGGRTFTVKAPNGNHTNVYELEFSFTGASTVTGTNQLNPLGFGFGAALPLGLLFRSQVEGTSSKQYTLKDNKDLLSFPGADIVYVIGDGTTASMKIRLNFRVPLELNHTVDDYLEFVVRDDLTGLAALTYSAAATEIFAPDGRTL